MCGTDADYHAHRRNGEHPCPACRAAHTEAAQRRRQGERSHHRWIDQSDHTVMFVCRCGWRTLTNDPAQAVAQARAHLTTHPTGDPHHDALAKWIDRNKGGQP